MRFYKNMNTIFHLLDGNTDFFDIDAGVKQGDTFAPYIFIIFLDYIQRQ